MVKPVGKGRQKLEMKKIENKTSLGVTFTKRRNGIFKKANELVTLCGASLAIIIFSPGKKAYSFGHPNVYTIFARFLSEIFNDVSLDSSFCDHLKYLEECQKSSVGKLCTQYSEIQKEAEIERNKAKEEKQAMFPPMVMPPKDQLSLSQAKQLQAMLKELKARVSFEIEKRSILESMEDGGNPEKNPINDDQLGIMFNSFDAPGPSNFIPSPNYGPWDL